MRALGLLFLLLPALAQNLAPAFQLDCRFRGRPGPPRSSGTGAPWGPAPSRSGLLRAATFSACASEEPGGTYLAYEARVEVGEGAWGPSPPNSCAMTPGGRP